MFFTRAAGRLAPAPCNAPRAPEHLQAAPKSAARRWFRVKQNKLFLVLDPSVTIPPPRAPVRRLPAGEPPRITCLAEAYFPRAAQSAKKGRVE